MPVDPNIQKPNFLLTCYKDTTVSYGPYLRNLTFYDKEGYAFKVVDVIDKTQLEAEIIFNYKGKNIYANIYSDTAYVDYIWKIGNVVNTVKWGWLSSTVASSRVQIVFDNIDYFKLISRITCNLTNIYSYTFKTKRIILNRKIPNEDDINYDYTNESLENDSQALFDWRNNDYIGADEIACISENYLFYAYKTNSNLYGPILRNLKFYDLSGNLIQITKFENLLAGDVTFWLYFQDGSKFRASIYEMYLNTQSSTLKDILLNKNNNQVYCKTTANVIAFYLTIPKNKIKYIQIVPNSYIKSNYITTSIKFYNTLPTPDGFATPIEPPVLEWVNNHTKQNLMNQPVKIYLQEEDKWRNTFMNNCNIDVSKYQNGLNVNLGDLIFDEESHNLYKCLKDSTLSGTIDTDINNGVLSKILEGAPNSYNFNYKGTQPDRETIISLEYKEIGDVYFSIKENVLYLWDSKNWIQIGTSNSQEYVISGDYKIVRLNNLYQVYINKPILQLIKNRKITTLTLLTDNRIKDVESFNIDIKGMPEALIYQPIVTENFEFKLNITNYSNVDINLNATAYIEFLTKSDLITEVQP